MKLFWPIAEPPDNLPYSLDVSAAINDAADTIGRATASVAPSGTGEIAVSAVYVSGKIVTVTMSGGVPGRLYFVNIVVYTATGRSFSFYVELPLSLDQATSALPPPPSPGFGPVVSS
jgi:hypothetical protein